MKLENARLLHDNTQLKHEIELLQKKLELLSEGENDKFRRMEENKRQLDHDLRQVKESRGKVFRGLNTQTEIAKVQFKRDFENLKKQMKTKDEIIALQEKKIASLTEEVSALRVGIQSLSSLPKRESSDSDTDIEEEESVRRVGSKRSSGIINGHTHLIHSNASMPVPLPNYASCEPSANVNTDLLQVISQLDSGKFHNT